MIDTLALKSQINLLDLIGSDTRLKKIAGTRGGEYAGPCPFCGGDDRFRVQPKRGLWWCRSCSETDRWSDAIGYVMRRDGTSFAVAARTLGGHPDAVRMRFTPARPTLPTPTPAPSQLWHDQAERVVRMAADVLWSDRGERARDYLHARGLTDATLRWFGTGYIPSDRYEDPDLWGLTLADGKRVWLPRGILIPWIVKSNDEVWVLKVRRPLGVEPKYIATSGSVPTIFGSMGLQGRTTLVLAEGEFDAMLLWQHAGDLVDVATLGSATKGLDHRAAFYMLPATRILVALDSDKAGEAGTAALLASSLRMRRLALPDGQDVTDYHLAGGDLRALVAGGAS